MDTTNNNKSLYSTIPPEVRGFLEDILQESDAKLDPQTKEMMVEELYVRLDKFLIGKIIEYLPEDKLEAFVTIQEETPSLEKVQQYLADNLPNAQDVFTVAFAEFRNLYMQGVEKADLELLEKSAPKDI